DLAVQYDAVDPDALLHGGAAERRPLSWTAVNSLPRPLEPQARIYGRGAKKADPSQFSWAGILVKQELDSLISDYFEIAVAYEKLFINSWTRLLRAVGGWSRRLWLRSCWYWESWPPERAGSRSGSASGLTG